MDMQGQRVRAEVRAIGERELAEVTIFLHDHVEHDFRPERLDDLLEKPVTFLEVEGAGGPRLLAKEALVWLRVRAPERDLSEDDLFATNRRIRVRFADGTSITGNVLYDIGDASAPLGEFMNRLGSYFEVVQEGQIYFVHKKFVAWVEEVTA